MQLPADVLRKAMLSPRRQSVVSLTQLQILRASLKDMGQLVDARREWKRQTQARLSVLDTTVKRCMQFLTQATQAGIFSSASNHWFIRHLGQSLIASITTPLMSRQLPQKLFWTLAKTRCSFSPSHGLMLGSTGKRTVAHLKFICLNLKPKDNIRFNYVYANFIFNVITEDRAL